MPKQSGIGSSLIVGAFDLSGFIGALTACEASRATVDVTAINATGPELLPGQKDGSLAFTSYWTGATAGEAHTVLSALPRTDVQVSALIGSTVGVKTMPVMPVKLPPDVVASAIVSVGVPEPSEMTCR